MDNEKLEYYKNLLLREREEILQELVDSDESARDLFETDSHNVNDSVDDASFTVAQNILNIVSSKNKQTLLAIEAGLRRIVEGSFGKCTGCGCEINENRLNAIPWATKCIECKTKDEKKK